LLRLLALFALAVVLWLLLESGAAFVRGRLTGRRPASRMPPPRPARTVALDLVRCAGCGIHVPRQRALQAGGAIYCNEACRTAQTPRAPETIQGDGQISGQG
jgi:uncharacterized protein